MSSDYDNPYGMSDDEFQYRAMNPQDPMYMGDTNKPSYFANDPTPYGADQGASDSQKKGKNKLFVWTDEDTFMAVLALIAALIIVGIILFVNLTWPF